MMIRRLLPFGLLALGGTLGACGGGESHSNPVSPPPDTTHHDTTGTVQKATLKVAVSLNAADSTVARALSLPADRRLVGVTVQIQRTGSSTVTSATTDSLGVATFTNVVPGAYQVSALRTLTSVESSHLAAADADVNALGSGASFSVQAPTTNGTLIVDAGRRGSLVISEEFPNYPRDLAGDFYDYAHYLELYNNSDTTIYLDGKTVVKGLPGWRDYSTYPCANEEQYRMDSLGIWTAWTYRFPGSGHDYPLPPGGVTLLAQDAIDHRPFDPNLPDLSGANFEFRGASDVDNPQVPDMISIGVRDGGMPRGHGLEFDQLEEVTAIAEPVDTAALPFTMMPSYTFGWKRIPRDKILDVLTWQVANYNYSAPLCGPSVNPIFDHQRGAFLNPGQEYRTIQRKVALVLPDGRKILLRTKTSSRDFQAAAMTPGYIP